MLQVGIVVEGLVDRAVVERILSERGLTVDPHRTVITGGKTTFDARLTKYNNAARLGAWLALRDADQDGDDCPVTLRRSLLPVPQSSALCLRLAVRTVEAWLLGDGQAFAEHFSVPLAKIPGDPEGLSKPKDALVTVCRHSRLRDVRESMTPPRGRAGTGPQYTARITAFCKSSWRPDVAALTAPSLRRTLDEIDRLCRTGVW